MRKNAFPWTTESLDLLTSSVTDGLAGKAVVGRALPFYGIDAPNENNMYEDEFDTWEKSDAVSARHAYTFAPEQSDDCKFVQDRIWRNCNDVAKMSRQGSQLYLCDAGLVGAGVEEVIVDIRTEQTSQSNQAEDSVTAQRGIRCWADDFA
jgi:cytochrome P450/NADPH-cytochrome P450 reductase